MLTVTLAVMLTVRTGRLKTSTGTYAEIEISGNCNDNKIIFQSWYQQKSAFFLTKESRLTHTLSCGVVAISIYTLSNASLYVTKRTNPSCVTDAVFIFVTMTMKTAFS